MTTQQLLTQLSASITASDNAYKAQIATLTTKVTGLNAQITALNVQIVALKANQLPTGDVQIVIKNADMSKVTIT